MTARGSIEGGGKTIPDQTVSATADVLKNDGLRILRNASTMPVMKSPRGNDLILGRLPGRSKSLGLSRTERDKHLYVCGGTGTGKSKFLENLIRQDIRNWSKSKYGLLVIDPHGNLYDNLINWLAWTGFERPIIPIDLRQDDWVVSYNLPRQRKVDGRGNKSSRSQTLESAGELRFTGDSQATLENGKRIVAILPSQFSWTRLPSRCRHECV